MFTNHDYIEQPDWTYPMPKPFLSPEETKLEEELIKAFMTGHNKWRPDLSYPQSYSDMQGGIREVMKQFHIEARRVALRSLMPIPGNDDNVAGKIYHCKRLLRSHGREGFALQMSAETWRTKVQPDVSMLQYLYGTLYGNNCISEHGVKKAK